MDIQKNPINAEEKSTSSRLGVQPSEEVCGTCTMVINGKTRQSCSALIDKLMQPTPCSLLASSCCQGSSRGPLQDVRSTEESESLGSDGWLP